MKNIHFEGDISTLLPKSVRERRVNRVIREELTELQRYTVLAYYFRDRSIPQIAQERGVNKSTVSRTLRRAEEKLRRFLR